MRCSAIQKLHRVLKSDRCSLFSFADVSNLLECDNVETAANVCVEFGLTVQVQEGTGTNVFCLKEKTVQCNLIRSKKA